MERTQTIERLMAALAPTVHAEVERTLEEAQKRLELEFESRLEEVRLEAAAQTRQMMAGEVAQARAEGAETARREIAMAMEPRIRTLVEEARREARERMRADLEATASQNAPQTAVDSTMEREQLIQERARLAEQLAEWRVLAGAELRLVEAGSQMEMLARFLKLAAGFAQSVAIYVARPEGLKLWKARGLAKFPPAISPQSAGTLYFCPIMTRGRPVAAIAAAPTFRRDALDFLAASLERSITMLGLKLQDPPATAAGRAEATDPVHADAREAARTLVSEIKSNREQDVLEGRVNADLYRRLQADIEAARGRYLERVPLGIAASRDYFDEALIRELAQDRPALMGAGYNGSPD
ncbi:MAG TPA: hypothetical protein VFY29_20815 [Terriglobia bacterium]|nr:hypothetical protein [Terriglobia bacterium]